ncbi:MAG: hypothetical protein EXQ51_05165 [Acidobacteria bacterium]|nr:hypothetical protein [Acidobacteriota bacterium]
MDLDNESPRSSPEARAHVKKWVFSALSLDPATVTVMVTELACLEPGCPPLETVIAVMDGGRPTWQYKLHKRADEVAWCEIIHMANRWDEDA